MADTLDRADQAIVSLRRKLGESRDENEIAELQRQINGVEAEKAAYTESHAAEQAKLIDVSPAEPATSVTAVHVKDDDTIDVTAT